MVTARGTVNVAPWQPDAEVVPIFIAFVMVIVVVALATTELGERLAPVEFTLTAALPASQLLPGAGVTPIDPVPAATPVSVNPRLL
jgi:hypothetical protein